MRCMRRVRCVLGDNCAVRPSCHDKPKKILTSLKVSICLEFRCLQCLVLRRADVVVNDSQFCLCPLH